MAARVVPVSTSEPALAQTSFLQQLLDEVRSFFGVSRTVEANLSDVGLNEEEIEELRMVSTFDDRSLRRLSARFLQLDREGNRRIHVDDILSMPEFQICPFRSRLRILFVSSLKSWQVSYREFVDLLAVFGPEASRDQKLKFLYRVYDFDDDGVLSSVDLTAAIETVTEDICDSAIVRKIVDKIFQECDLERRGYITLKQFREALGESDVGLRVRLSL